MAKILIDRDLGYDKAMAALRSLGAAQRRAVVVGIRGEAGEELVTIGAVHEFGSDDGVIPERSYLRATLDGNREVYIELFAEGLRRVIDGDTDLETMLGRLGLKVAGDVQQLMVDLDSPANADSTVAAKGSSNPLIDTGRLRQSVSSEVR